MCRSIFTDPVTLPCGHSLCRCCVTAVPGAECPQCRAALPPKADLELLPTSHILQSLAQRAKERPQQSQSPGAAEEPWLCPEHDERMKLFCVTDQRLICTICRDGEAHDGHKFKPIREAAAGLRRDIDLGLDNIKSQMEEIEKLRETQSGEMKKTKDLSAQLKSQVQREFETMHQFLRRREDEILNELKLKEEDTVENMNNSLNAMNQALTECGEQRESWTHIREVTDPERFLRRWSEECGTAAASDLSKLWTEGLAVVQSPLFQGPYQSHLQFFIWKEMLQVVEPKAELLTLKNTPYLSVSEDKRSFHCIPQRRQNPQPSGFGSFYNSSPFDVHSSRSSFTFGQASYVPENFSVSSTNEFSSGQHYWEVEVGLRGLWCVGIQDYFFKYENQKYSVCRPNYITELEISDRILKLGVYLDCSSKTLTFYDADSMVRLQKMSCGGLTLPVSAYFSIRQMEPDTYPITICRYS